MLELDVLLEAYYDVAFERLLMCDTPAYLVQVFSTIYLVMEIRGLYRIVQQKTFDGDTTFPSSSLHSSHERGARSCRSSDNYGAPQLVALHLTRNCSIWGH